MEAQAGMARNEVHMLTMFEEEDKIFGALKAGAMATYLRKIPTKRSSNPYKQCIKGESAMNGMIATKVLDYFHAQQKKNKRCA
jgi:DNA-binding NarL/FixJ family response regulator